MFTAIVPRGRPDRDFDVISLQIGDGNSIPDTTLKAERRKPVAAQRFFGRKLNSIPASQGFKLCFQPDVCKVRVTPDESRGLEKK